MGCDRRLDLGSLQHVSRNVRLDREQSPKLAKGDESCGFAAEVNYRESRRITG